MSNLIRVTLTDDDMNRAIDVGYRRELDWRQSLQPSFAIHYRPVDHLMSNISSAASELAVANFLGLPWAGEEYGGPAGCDVGDNIEVRQTAIRSDSYGLYVKNREVFPGPYQKKPSTIYVLAYQNAAPDYWDLVGWAELDYVMKWARKHEKNGVTGWILPAGHLKPMTDLL